MKVKKLGALILSVAMVFTSFSVPVFAEEIVDEQIAEIVEEASEEIVEESVIEEVTSADAEIVEALDEEVITGKSEEVNDESAIGNSYIVGSSADFEKYLKSDVDKTGKETGKNKFVLADGNKGRMVTLVLATDVEVSTEAFKIPSDRYLHIDLNGHDLRPTVSSNALVLERTGTNANNYKYPSLVVENSTGIYHSTFGFEVLVNGYDSKAVPKSGEKCLLEIGDAVATSELLTNDGGIVKIDSGALVNGGISSEGYSTTNIQGTVSSSVSGNGISLANAKILGGEVVSTGDLYVSGKTQGDITVASGSATIAGDADTKRDKALGTINICATGDVTMQSGLVEKINIIENGGLFTMYGGRVENTETTAITVTGADSKVTLIGGVVAAPSANAITPGKWFDMDGDSITNPTTKYIVNGEASDSDSGEEGTITDAYDLENALKFGGNYVLAGEVDASGLTPSECTVTAAKPIKITNKANYKIDLGSNTLKLNGRALTIGVNIESNSTVIDASAEGSKLTVIGGSINKRNLVSGNAILVNSIDDVTADSSANKSIKLAGGIVAGSAGNADGTLNDVTISFEDNCAIIDKAGKGYCSCAAVLVGGKPVIKPIIDVVTPYVVLADIDGYRSIDVDKVFECRLLGVLPSKYPIKLEIANTRVATVEDDEKIVRGTSEGITRVTCSMIDATVAGKEVVIAEDYAIIENSNESSIEDLASMYNVTLLATKGTINAYKKFAKIYFDFHLDSSSEEFVTGGYEKSIYPYQAAINVPAKSKFAYYFKQNANGLYDVKFDNDRNMYYVELLTEKATGDAMESTRLLEDGVEEFERLKFNIQFGVGVAPAAPLFSVPATKYSYKPLNKNGKPIDNPEVAYTLEIDDEEPELEFEEDVNLVINKNYKIEDEAAYDLIYPELKNADSNYIKVNPGFINGADIENASTGNLTLSNVEVIKPGKFNSTGSFAGHDLKIFYKGAAPAKSDDDDKKKEEEKKKPKGDPADKSAKLNVLVRYDDYYGDFELEVPVKIKTAQPEVKISKASFSVEKNKAVSNIPIFFKSEDADALGAITGIEVVSGRKFFTVQSANEAVNTTDDETFTKGGYSLTIAPVDGTADKVTRTGKIKVYFGNYKPVNGADYVKTYNIKVTAISPQKLTVNAKTSDVLNIKTAEESRVDYELVTNPVYSDSNAITVKLNAYNNGVRTPHNAEDDGISITKIVDGKFSIVKSEDANTSNLKKLELVINWPKVDKKGNPAVGEKKITVKTNAKAPAVAKKTVTVKMKLGAEFSRKYADGRIKRDITAAKMAKSLDYKGTNIRFATISGNDADLFEVTETAKGKTVKITPSLDALKAGKLQPGDYTFDIKYYEAGTTILADAETSVTVKILEPSGKNKAVAAISTGRVRMFNRSPYNGGEFTIQTKKPYYGMQIKSVELAKASDKDRYEIEDADAKTGFTAIKNGQGSENSTFRIMFKDGKVPTETKKGKTTEITGVQKVKLLVTYENGLTANVNLDVNIYGL